MKVRSKGADVCVVDGRKELGADLRVWRLRSERNVVNMDSIEK